MTNILQKQGSIAVVHGEPAVASALIVFHLDGCFFCEITLGALMYEMAQPDSVLVAKRIHPFQLLIDHEGPSANHTYCSDVPSCAAQLLALTRVSIASITSFPTTNFFSANATRSNPSDTKCGIFIRGNAPDGCQSKAPEKCAPLRNAVSNWICGMVLAKPAPSDQCDETWWRTQGCASHS